MASVHEDSLKYSLTPEKDSAFYISLNTTIMLSNHLAVKYSPKAPLPPLFDSWSS